MAKNKTPKKELIYSKKDKTFLEKIGGIGKGRNKEDYIESSLPQSKQKHIGWFYNYPTKKYYRWDNFPNIEK